MSAIKPATIETLLAHAVMTARSGLKRRKAHPRWFAVMEAFEIGPRSAIELCKRFKINPHELVWGN